VSRASVASATTIRSSLFAHGNVLRRRPLRRLKRRQGDREQPDRQTPADPPLHRPLPLIAHGCPSLLCRWRHIPHRFLLSDQGQSTIPFAFKFARWRHSRRRERREILSASEGLLHRRPTDASSMVVHPVPSPHFPESLPT
jgi:hypothetical protein